MRRHTPPFASEPAISFADEEVSIVTPGQAEKELFQCDPSCETWEHFQGGTTLENLQKAAAIVAEHSTSPSALEYWAKHAARTSYFLGNAIAGTLTFELFGESGDQLPNGFLGTILRNGTDTASRLILESIMTYEQDWQRISNCKYNSPWDMTLGHRQTTLPYALRQSARFVEEAVGTLERRSRAAPEDRTIWLDSGNDLYPEYYKTNYHYQTDGWMSAKSAAVYETSTETLFLGKQDAMQRASLIPLQGLERVVGRPLRILEVACGTGRFGTFLRDNHPDAEYTCVDLSPFYLEAARENDEYWRDFTRRVGDDREYSAASFVQAAAEKLPFEAESFDAVVCVYLFHEMPEGARAAAAAEMARVLAPGGTLVLTDSLQLGDRPMLDGGLAQFKNLNEPHYPNYISTNLADIFVPHGLECGHKYLVSSSKTISFTKPPRST
jgi:ubiquinone/menaquinone biosynthesis C-methylase UbiE